jgi:hypothetical protein
MLLDDVISQLIQKGRYPIWSHPTPFFCHDHRLLTFQPPYSFGGDESFPLRILGPPDDGRMPRVRQVDLANLIHRFRNHCKSNSIINFGA